MDRMMPFLRNCIFLSTFFLQTFRSDGAGFMAENRGKEWQKLVEWYEKVKDLIEAKFNDC